MRTLPTALCIKRTFYSGWRKHELCSALCEIQWLFYLLVPTVLSLASDSFCILMQINSSQRFKDTSADFWSCLKNILLASLNFRLSYFNSDHWSLDASCLCWYLETAHSYNWGKHRTHLFPFTQMTLLWHLLSITENSCFIYFVQFSGCFGKESKPGFC